MQPSIESYQKNVDHAHMITQGSFQLGSPEFRPTSQVTTTGVSYVPYSNQLRQHITPAPKDLLMLTTCKGEEGGAVTYGFQKSPPPHADFAQSSATHEAFQPNAAKPAKGGAVARKIMHNEVFVS